MINKIIKLSDTNEKVYLETFVARKMENFVRRPILVIPGGGYGGIAEKEGEPIAEAFLPYGYNAFVLRYTTGRKGKFPCQLIEAARAIKHIKDNAEEYNIDPDQLMVVGFSAGGHLAACTGTMWKMDEVYKNVDMPYGYNKPKGVILMYPVISPKFENHIKSFKNLLCTDDPTPEQLSAAAIEDHVDADSSPAFILHTVNDKIVDVRNAFTVAEAYTEAGVPFEMHIYPKGPHGMGLANDITSKGEDKYIDGRIAEWVRFAVEWAETL